MQSMNRKRFSKSSSGNKNCLIGQHHLKKYMKIMEGLKIGCFVSERQDTYAHHAYFGSW